MPSIVDADRLSKTFQVKVRDPGLRGALRALLRPRYRDVHAVPNVTFRIDPGEIVAFLGPNGAGKTTTLKMLAGLLYPTSGRVEAAGFVPWTGGPPFKRRIALVLGNRQQLVWDLPPEETFLLNRAIYDIPEPAYRDRLAELVDLLELRDVLEKPVRQLSLGERMKCELAAALLHHPPLLFLDQPPPPGGASRGRPVDRGPAHRGCDPPGVRAGAGRGRVIRPGDWLRRYGALLRAAWLQDLQYRASIVLWLLWGVTEPAVALGIWWAIAADGPVQGYARADFARYFFALMLVNQLTIAWDSWYLDSWIREGELNFRLARPIHPAHEAVAENIAYKARTAGMILVVWLIVAAAWPAVRLPFGAGRWALTAAAVLLAAAMRFFISFATGLLAFWTTRATAIMELHAGISLFLSGRLAPLALLPPAVARVAVFLWFPYMLAFPVDLLTGTVHGAALVQGFVGQVVWLAVWVGAYRLACTRGLRKYGAVGG